MDTHGSSSPSLRLKIKLGPNMKAEPASPRVPPTHQEEEGKLKIIIKKRSDGQGNTTPSNTNIPNEKVNLSLIPFPVTSNCPFFQKACSYSSFEQLEKWSEKELNSLAEELETLRKSFKDFNTSLQNQLDALETWRARSQIPRKNGESVPPSPSTAPLKFESITSPIPVHTPTTPVAHGASSAKANSKNIHKKRKTHQNDSSDGDDKDPSFVKKESDSEPSSEDEDEIDVVDIDDSVASEDNKDKARSQSADYNFGKKDQKNKMNVGTRNKRNAVGRRNKQNKGSRQSTRERKKSRKGEEMDSDADDPLGKWPNGNFWRDVEAYFTPYTNEDLKFCSPVQISSDDPIFKIPPLGKPEEFDAGEDEDAYEPVRSLRTSTPREPPPPPPPVERVVENQDHPDKLPSCGDLTSRILSALIEEKIVPMTMDISTPQDVEMNGDANGVEIASPFKTPSDEFLPLETPPTYDYSHQSMMNLEDRIKLELKSIGLLDDEDLNIDSSSREDDEICSEMRRLQKQLREQILNNNTMRTKVHSLLEQAMVKEDQQKKERGANATLEKTYFKLMRKKKRKPTGKEIS